MKHLTGKPNYHALFVDCILGHLTSLRWPQGFLHAPLILIWVSMYIFFRRAFSALSSFILTIKDASMPPNFARQLSNVGTLIQCPRHTSGTARPFSTRFRIDMICLSVNLDCFIAELSSPLVENSTSDPAYLLGGLP